MHECAYTHIHTHTHPHTYPHTHTSPHTHPHTHTHTELTALRSKVTELSLELAAATNHTHSQAQLEYSQLVDNLYSATMAIKSRYEEYRGRLHGDMTRSLYEVRQSVAESVKKMKEKLEIHGGDVTIGTDGAVADDIAMVTRLKAEGVKDIQQENAELSKLVSIIFQSRTLELFSRH